MDLRLAVCGGVAAAALALLSPGEGLAACNPTGTNQTCTNSEAISGNPTGINDTDTLTLTNTDTGSIAGSAHNAPAYGVNADTANVSNWGAISGTGTGTSGRGLGIFGTTAANVSNWGSISATGTKSGNSWAISSYHAATVSNWGTISASAGSGGEAFGVSAGQNNGTANVDNWGTISASGENGFGVYAAYGTANVTNWGTISGTGTSNSAFGVDAVSGTANVTNWGTISADAKNNGYGIDAKFGTIINGGTISANTYALKFDGNATVTLLPGSILIGRFHLGGASNTVNILTGNQNLTFDTLTGTTLTSTVPIVISGTQVVTVDPTSFAMTGRNVMDFTGNVSSTLEDRFDAAFGDAAAGGGPALGYAEENDVGARFANAFAGQSSDTPKLANLSAQYADGTTLWARGFAGERVQQDDGTLIGSSTGFFGGMLGADRQLGSDLRLGAFLGGGQTRLSEDHDLGGDDSDLVLGGLYGRYERGPSFLGALLQGGYIHTRTMRAVNNNALPNGIETAAASYDGWYIGPQATFGRHYALGRLGGASYTLTPSVSLRYLYASLGGYTESGTSAPLTVGGRTVSDLGASAGLSLARMVRLAPGSTLTSTLFGGVFGDRRGGTATIDAELLGQAIPFAVPGKKNAWGGFAGIGVSGRTGPVDLSAATRIYFSASGYVVSGTGGVRASF